MTAPASPADAARVAVVAPFGRDAEVLSSLLARHGFEVGACARQDPLASELEREPADVLLLSEEALGPATVDEIRACLVAEADWSALPMVVLTDGSERVSEIVADLRTLRPTLPVTLLLRPAPALEVVRAVEAAVRARRAQRMVGDLLHRHEAAEAHIRQRLQELDHRTKNLLGTINALARQTLGGTVDRAAFAQDFSNRLWALAQTYDVLSTGDFTAISLEDLASRILAPFRTREGQVSVAGRDVVLSPGLGQTLGICLHELGTNAVKYGALSCPEGRVDLAWTLTAGGDHLRMTWRETGGPEVEPPSRHGFGTMFIGYSLEHQAQGRAELDFRPEGLVCVLEVPLRPS